MKARPLSVCLLGATERPQLSFQDNEDKDSEMSTVDTIWWLQKAESTGYCDPGNSRSYSFSYLGLQTSVYDGGNTNTYDISTHKAK